MKRKRPPNDEMFGSFDEQAMTAEEIRNARQHDEPETATNVEIDRARAYLRDRRRRMQAARRRSR